MTTLKETIFSGAPANEEKTPPSVSASITRKQAAGNFGAEAPRPTVWARTRSNATAVVSTVFSKGPLLSRRSSPSGGSRWEKDSMKKVRMLVLALLTIAAINTAKATDATVSPNGFKSPECTFGADTLTSWFGWNLKFSQSYGRDAKLWPSLLTNGARTTNPQEGCLMVLDGWDLNPSGHVAWVWGRQGYWTCVLHTNMKVGTDYFTYGGASFRYCWFYYYPGWTSVYCGDNGKWYPLRAFVTKK
jgi:hypothetical protein